MIVERLAGVGDGDDDDERTRGLSVHWLWRCVVGATSSADVIIEDASCTKHHQRNKNFQLIF